MPRAVSPLRCRDIETFPNQYKGYEITIEIPEYTAICPKTSLPDFGIITVHYMPDANALNSNR